MDPRLRYELNFLYSSSEWMNCSHPLWRHRLQIIKFRWAPEKTLRGCRSRTHDLSESSQLCWPLRAAPKESLNVLATRAHEFKLTLGNACNWFRLKTLIYFFSLAKNIVKFFSEKESLTFLTLYCWINEPSLSLTLKLMLSTYLFYSKGYRLCKISHWMSNFWKV